jgi:hypothetical protein
MPLVADGRWWSDEVVPDLTGPSAAVDGRTAGEAGRHRREVGMDLTTDIGMLAFWTLVIGAIALGIVLQFIGDVRFGYEWIATAVAAFAGGFVASEWIVAFSTVEPIWDGMALIPAIGGALVVGVIVDAIIRYTTHGSYTHHAPVA